MKAISMHFVSWMRLLTVSLLTAGLLISVHGFAWADRGSDRGREKIRYEERTRYEYPGHRYGHREKVTVVRELPRGHRKVVVKNRPYYVHDHRYYTRGPSGYILVRPPIGAIVASLPFGAVNVTIGGVFYSHYDQVYYRPTRGGYQVVGY